MPAKNQSEVVADLAVLLADFQDREYPGEITAETLFFGDLGFMSIDAIVLGETLEAKYQQKFPFNTFLAELSQRGAEDITVGELAAFVATNLNA